MINRIFTIGIVCLLVIGGFLSFITLESDVVSAGTTWDVGSGPGNDTAFIGYAVTVLADPGDTVFVHSGVYVESLWINKTITLVGEDRNTTIIDGGGAKVVQIFNTDWVNITGFTITNGSDGIWTTYSSNCTFINNTVHDNNGENGFKNGFFFSGCPYSNNKIIGNFIYNNEGDGIHLEEESSIDSDVFWNNSIINNTIYNNTGYGIVISQGSTNFIEQGGSNCIINNVIYNNGVNDSRAGIRIKRSSNNSVIGNTVYNNHNGIVFENTWYKYYKTSMNYIAGNKVYNNDDSGIVLIAATDNTFIENSIFDNNYNIHMEQQSRDNNFINCTLLNASIDDFNVTDDSHAILLNTTFNKTNVYYGDTLSTLTVKWFMHVHVMYYNGSPASYAEIWINDTSGSGVPLLYGPADSQGWIRWFVVTEYIERDMVGDHMGNGFYLTPHHVTATDGSLWGYTDPYMDISKVVLIILGTPPPLLPPTNLTTKAINNGNNIELEWEPSPSFTLDHYLIYRADSATGFDFTLVHNNSITWPNPLNTIWIDPDPGVTAVDDDFYYIVRAANFDESETSSTSNTAGVWTRTFEPSTSTFSLPLEPFEPRDVEFYCQDMNATYIRWMNQTTHTWTRHDRGDSGNYTFLEVGEGYEIGFDGQTRYTFCGFPGAMISYDDDILFSGFDPDTEAKNLTVTVEPDGNVTLAWQEPASMGPGDWYEVYYSNTRDGFFKTFGLDYDLACPPIGYGTDTTTITGLGVNDPGARLYFMILPFNSLGIRGASTYSIGIWTEEYLAEYDTFGIPLKMDMDYIADWFCNNIPDTVGINYYIVSEQRWGWHSTRMPEGAYDPTLMMAEGYQISNSNSTNFIFIGI